MKKAILSVALTVFILFSSCVVCFAANPTVELVSKRVVDNTLKVDVVLKDNPGVIVMRLKLNYDTDALKLKQIEDKAQLGENIHTDNLGEKDIFLYWSNPTASENYTFNGTVATLCFDVLDSSKSADISLSYDIDNYDIFNFDLNKVNFKTDSITVDLSNTVSDTQSVPQNNEPQGLGVWFYVGVAVLVFLIATVVVMVYVKKRDEKDN